MVDSIAPSADGKRQDPRIALAMSVLGHHPRCAHCDRSIEKVILALQGATIDEIQRVVG